MKLSDLFGKPQFKRLKYKNIGVEYSNSGTKVIILTLKKPIPQVKGSFGWLAEKVTEIRLTAELAFTGKEGIKINPKKKTFSYNIRYKLDVSRNHGVVWLTDVPFKAFGRLRRK